MPFQSSKQERFMWANHPDIAKRWEAEAKVQALNKKKQKKDKPK